MTIFKYLKVCMGGREGVSILTSGWKLQVGTLMSDIKKEEIAWQWIEGWPWKQKGLGFKFCLWNTLVLLLANHLPAF